MTISEETKPNVTHRVLTPEERQLVDLFVGGLTNRTDIAEKLGINLDTVKVKFRREEVKWEIRRLQSLKYLDMMKSQLIQEELIRTFEILKEIANNTEVAPQSRVNASKEIRVYIEKYAHEHEIEIPKFIDVPENKYAMMEKNYKASIDVESRLEQGEAIEDILGLKRPEDGTDTAEGVSSQV